MRLPAPPASTNIADWHLRVAGVDLRLAQGVKIGRRTQLCGTAITTFSSTWLGSLDGRISQTFNSARCRAISRQDTVERRVMMPAKGSGRAGKGGGKKMAPAGVGLRTVFSPFRGLPCGLRPPLRGSWSPSGADPADGNETRGIVSLPTISMLA